MTARDIRSGTGANDSARALLTATGDTAAPTLASDGFAVKQKDFYHVFTTVLGRVSVFAVTDDTEYGFTINGVDYTVDSGTGATTGSVATLLRALVIPGLTLGGSGDDITFDSTDSFTIVLIGLDGLLLSDVECTLIPWFWTSVCDTWYACNPLEITSSQRFGLVELLGIAERIYLQVADWEGHGTLKCWVAEGNEGREE